MIQVFIDGEEVKVQAGSYNIQNNHIGFDTCTFTVLTEEPRYFRKYEEVEVFENGFKVFGGTVHKVSEVGAKHDYLTHPIQCRGNEYLADKRIIARAFQNMYTGDIVRALHDLEFKHEGLKLGVVEKGVRLGDVKFGYITGLTALERLAERSDYILKINQHKEINFRSKETNLAPFTLNFDNAITGSVRVDKGNEEYRNKQYHVGGRAVTNPMTEIIKKGDNDNFIVAYPVANQPEIYVSTNGGDTYIQQTVGVKGLDEEGTRDFFFSYSSETITHDRESSLYEDVDYVKIIYQGLYPVVVVNQIDYEIEDMKNLDGGTGIVGKVIESSITGLENIIEENLHTLNKLGVQESFKVEYDTWIDGLEAGMLQEVYLPEHNIRGVKGLITSVRKRDHNNTFRYSVTVIYGPGHSDWVEFFSRDKKEFDNNDLLEGTELVQQAYQFSKTWEESEFPNVFATKVYPSSNTFPSTTLFPSLEPNQEIRYLAYYINGVEEGRVPVIGLLKNEHGLHTRALIGQGVSGTINKLAWIGGELATNEVGTGFYLDIQDVEIVKSGLEVAQIEKTEVKGW